MKNQKGFSIVIVLLCILVVSFIGFAGYYVWNTQQDKKEKEVATVAGAQEQAPAVKEESQPTPTAQDAQKYLEIKEWGVKIPLTQTISDAAYNFDSFNNSAGLYKVSYAQYCPSGYGGYIGRFKDANDPLFARDTVGPGTFDALVARSVKINEYYYYYISPQSMCGDPNNLDGWDQKSQEMTQAFKSASASLRAI